jgi:hypothetical protein
MSLTMVRPPEEVIAPLGSGLVPYLADTPLAGYVPDIPNDLSFQAPVFVVDQTEGVSVGDLDHLKPVAWRFVLNWRGIPSVICDVSSVDKNHELTIVMVSEPYARGLIDAFRRISAVLEDFQGRDFRGRDARFFLYLFEAPAFDVRALWLHGDSNSNLFATVHGLSPEQRPGPLMPAGVFLESFNKTLSAKLEEHYYVDFENEVQVYNEWFKGVTSTHSSSWSIIIDQRDGVISFTPDVPDAKPNQPLGVNSGDNVT